MEYIIGLLVLVAICIAFFLWRNKKSLSPQKLEGLQLQESQMLTAEHEQDDTNQLMICLEQLPIEAIPPNAQLVEITDERVLAKIDNLVPGLLQVGNVAQNLAQANCGPLYQAIIPAGAKLANSKDMEGAVRGIYHGADGIKGHANLVEVNNSTNVTANIVASAMGVASMVVGQYYMSQISSDLNTLSNGVSSICGFQDNEYHSKVFELVAHVQEIAKFRVDILENDELRLSEIDNLNRYKQECGQLLKQACLTIEGYTQHQDLKYEEYEALLPEIEKWHSHQTILFEVMIKISELKHALHLGAVSAEQCSASLLTYGNQVKKTQETLSAWHKCQAERLNIDVSQCKRKRVGFDSVIYWLPSLINEENKYRPIAENTVRQIVSQSHSPHNTSLVKTVDRFQEDVRIIAKDGKIYYLASE